MLIFNSNWLNRNFGLPVSFEPKSLDMYSRVLSVTPQKILPTRYRVKQKIIITHTLPPAKSFRTYVCKKYVNIYIYIRTKKNFF